MVVSKALVAKIDRPMGIVCFQSAKDSNDILNSWSMNLEKLLDLVEKSCHQIHKETMVHKAALKVWERHFTNYLVEPLSLFFTIFARISKRERKGMLISFRWTLLILILVCRLLKSSFHFEDWSAQINIDCHLCWLLWSDMHLSRLSLQ